MCGTELHFLDGLLAPASAVVPVPEGLGLPTAASLCCSATTALHAVDVAGMRSGDTAVVYGLGGVGLALVQVLREAGVRVIGVARSEARLRLAEEMGRR